MIKLLVAVVCCVAVAMPVIQAQTTYTTKYDNVNIDEILQNDRLFNNYYNCLMNNGKCTQEGDFLKKIVPEALENKCANCTDKQKINAEKIIKFLSKNRKEALKKLAEKYDSQGIYIQRYQEDAKKADIEI